MATPYLDLRALRSELGLTQTEFAGLLSVSARTVQSCEQGWRNPSAAVEKSALLLLLAHRHGQEFRRHSCWEVLGCSDGDRKGCLVFQTGQGHLCWLLSGNICHGTHLGSWADKKATCHQCTFFRELLPQGFPFRNGV